MVSSGLVILALFPAAAALQLADSKQASAEIAKKCMEGDFAGATALLESRGKPIGWQHGKYMLMSCFTDETGQCLLDSSRCAWLQQCISQDGPCEPPKLTSLLELPGGEYALAKLNSDSNSSVMVKDTPHYKMSKILGVTKELVEEYKQAMSPETEEASSLVQQKSKLSSQGPIKRARLLAQENKDIAALRAVGKSAALETLKATIAASFQAMIAKKERLDQIKEVWLSPKKQKKWAYLVATMPLYYLAVCGMEDQGMQYMTTSSYAKFAPYGIDKEPVYNDEVHKWKFDPTVFTDEWTCHR